MSGVILSQASHGGRLVAIDGLDGYFAGDDGHIYSNVSDRSGPPLRLAERIYPKKDDPKAAEYRHVFLRRKRFLVHRLICIAFHGPPPFSGAKVLHGDDVGSNNVPENLRWGTAQDNYEDSRKAGRVAVHERHGSAKLTRESVRQIRASDKTMRELAAEHHVDKSVISRVRAFKIWKNV